MRSKVKQTESVNESTRMFRAFADPTRLRLLNLLSRGERCVCELVDVIGQPQPKISRHLAYLRKAGLVKARREGLWVYYRLAEPTSEIHRKLVECVRCCLSEIPQLAADLKALRSCCGG